MSESCEMRDRKSFINDVCYKKYSLTCLCPDLADFNRQLHALTCTNTVHSGGSKEGGSGGWNPPFIQGWDPLFNMAGSVPGADKQANIT